jgi:hypothetical protein
VDADSQENKVTIKLSVEIHKGQGVRVVVLFTEEGHLNIPGTVDRLDQKKYHHKDEFENSVVFEIILVFK